MLLALTEWTRDDHSGCVGQDKVIRIAEKNQIKKGAKHAYRMLLTSAGLGCAGSAGHVMEPLFKTINYS